MENEIAVAAARAAADEAFDADEVAFGARADARANYAEAVAVARAAETAAALARSVAETAFNAVVVAVDALARADFERSCSKAASRAATGVFWDLIK